MTAVQHWNPYIFELMTYLFDDFFIAVMGDAGKLYVSGDIIPVYREILPLATIITPNHFEVERVDVLAPTFGQTTETLLQGAHKRPDTLRGIFTGSPTCASSGIQGSACCHFFYPPQWDLRHISSLLVASKAGGKEPLYG